MQILSYLSKALLAGTMIAIILAVGLGVVFRYVLNSPLFWSDEVSRYALVWMTFLGGASLVGRAEGHVKVDYFVDIMSPRMKRFANLFAAFVVAGLLCLVTVGGVLWILKSTHASSPAMGVPMIFVYAVIPISGVIGIARLIRYLLSDTTTAVKD